MNTCILFYGARKAVVERTLRCFGEPYEGTESLWIFGTNPAEIINTGMYAITDYNQDKGFTHAWIIGSGVKAPSGKEIKALLAPFASAQVAAVHPVNKRSMYEHIRGSLGLPVRRVPFIEFTALLVSVEAWKQVGPLDEELPATYNLDWSYRATQLGLGLVVTSDAVIKYEPPKGMPWMPNKDHLVEKWGEDWEDKLWPSKMANGEQDDPDS